MLPYIAIGLLVVYSFHGISLSHLCPSRYPKKKTIAIWIVLILVNTGMGLCMLYLFPGELGRNLAYLITIFLNIVVEFFTTNDRFPKTLFFFLAYAQAFTVILFLSGFLAFRFWGKTGPIQFLLLALLHLALTMLCVAVSKKPLQQLSNGLVHGWWPLNCLSGLLLVYLSYISLRIYSTAYRLEETVFFVVLLSVILAVYAVFFHTIHFMYHAAERQRADLQSQFLLRQVETMQESIDEAQRIRHDARHHNMQIQEYLQNEEYDALQRYLGEYERDAFNKESLRICDNLAANSILSAYVRKAKQHGITVHFAVTLERDIGISDIDIVAMLANLMENAICGCLKSKKTQKEIDVYIGPKLTKLVIYVCNTAEEDVIFENGLPTSQSGQGIGVTSILHSAAHYGGECDFRQEDGQFICQILLKLPKSNLATK